MSETLLHELEARGYRARVVSIRRLDDLERAIESHHRQGLLDPELYQEYLAGFTFRPPEDMPEARSLIAVAFADPPARFTFHWRGEAHAVVVPPTYLHPRENDKRAERALAERLEPEGYRVARILVPKKLLAVCSGVALYGRNNITYVEGMGSMHRLVTFCSDLPCEQDEWREPQALERCERCQACASSCPTGAITPERFLLRAERCITFWNEKPGHVAFPEWMDASWHNSLVGCMHCQMACPENRAVRDRCEQGAAFSEEETGLLLHGTPLDGMPSALADKLRQWDLAQFLEFLPRNLRGVLEGA